MLEFYVQMIHLACCGSAFLKHLLKPTLLQVLCSNSLSVLCKCCGRDSSAYLALALTFTLCWRQKNTSKVLFNPVRCFAVTGHMRARSDTGMTFLCCFVSALGSVYKTFHDLLIKMVVKLTPACCEIEETAGKRHWACEGRSSLPCLRCTSCFNWRVFRYQQQNAAVFL